MEILIFSFLWVVAHFLFYVFWLRYNLKLREEKNIFLFHMISFLFFSFLLLIFYLFDGFINFWYSFIAALSVHGIYSMSFNLFWSSSQGGFSLGMIKKINVDKLSRQECLDHFIRIGDNKRSSRLNNLQKMGLIKREDSKYKIDNKGRFIAYILRMLHFINNFGKTG